MLLSKNQTNLILINLRERMCVKKQKGTNKLFCKNSVRLTPYEIEAFDLAISNLRDVMFDKANNIIMQQCEGVSSEK